MKIAIIIAGLLVVSGNTANAADKRAVDLAEAVAACWGNRAIMTDGWAPGFENCALVMRLQQEADDRAVVAHREAQRELVERVIRAQRGAKP